MTSFHEIGQRVRPHLRNAAVLAVAALAVLVAGHEFAVAHGHVVGYRAATWACAAVFVVLGVSATRSAAAELARWAGQHAGTATTAPLRVIVQVVGYLLTVLGLLNLLGIDLSQLLIGGAVTGVVLGIAAQQALGNFFAGMVLMLTRPYVPGDRVTVYSGAVNGPHTGIVTDVGLIYTIVRTEAGPLHLPNSVLMASGVAPGGPVPVE